MKTSKIASFVLEQLRAAAFGATVHQDGARWTKTESRYPVVIELGLPANPDEPAARPITEAQFTDALAVLEEDSQIFADGDFLLVRLPSLLKETDMFNPKTATIMQLVAKWNELNPGKLVKRFADRATAEKRVTASLAGAAADTIDDRRLAKAEKAPAKAATKAPAKAKAAKAPKAEKAEKRVRKAPEGSRLAERTIRHSVTVDGAAYKSVADAFRALKLPMGKHIRFRGALKTSPSGKLAFENGAKSYAFKLVPRD